MTDYSKRKKMDNYPKDKPLYVYSSGEEKYVHIIVQQAVMTLDPVSGYWSMDFDHYNKTQKVERNHYDGWQFTPKFLVELLDQQGKVLPRVHKWKEPAADDPYDSPSHPNPKLAEPIFVAPDHGHCTRGFEHRRYVGRLRDNGYDPELFPNVSAFRFVQQESVGYPVGEC